MPGPRIAVKIPPTRNHHQLAAWINAQQLVDEHGRPVFAFVERYRASTDRKIPGTRLRRPGKGREGLLLEIWPAASSRLRQERLYRHASSETYRKHSEARAWVEQNLRRAP